MAMTPQAYRMAAAGLVVGGLSVWTYISPISKSPAVFADLDQSQVVRPSFGQMFDPVVSFQGVPVLHDVGCFDIQSITLFGAEQLDDSVRSDVLDPLVGRCLRPAQLSGALQSIVDHYRQQGYAKPQVSMPRQGLKSGRLEITVVETHQDRAL